MKHALSIRARLVGGAAVMLVAFVAGAGLAVQRAHADSVRAAHFAQLQGTVYLLLAGAELDPGGALVMPPTLAEPRLALPGSGLYASIVNVARQEEWRSGSAVGAELPFERSAAVGQWRYGVVSDGGGAYLAVSYGVKWAGRAADATLALSVLEDRAQFDRELRIFGRTLWGWLGGAALLLLASQTLLLQWGLSPLRRVAKELSRVENGEQEQVGGRYPAEIAGLTDNLNTLIHQERVRQKRYREALSFLAHSLKTPLAVLRTALDDPARLRATVAQQVTRMDDIVQHQLGRAAAGGSARFVPALAIAPILHRIGDSLDKVYTDKALAIDIDCPPDLNWRIDEGDAFELFGNVLDNAAKWAKHRVVAQARRNGGRLLVQVQDDGPGFGDTSAILQLHVRADEQVPGHGVGLAVVNELVTSHGGELHLGRAALGGAQVDIVLPRP